MKANTLTRYLHYHLYHARLMLHTFNHKKKVEHLHEFRIALRQTHSLVKLFLDDAAPFPTPIKAAIKATNPIRELDVLMSSISLSEYPKLIKQLSKIRKDTLESLFTPDFVAQLTLIIDAYYDQIATINPAPIPEILVQRVLTHYQYCINTHKSLKEDAKPKTLHHLRIAFKDARYGFEFLDISNIHECQEIIQHCKQLQNNLGAVQDAFNQLEWLEKLYQNHPSHSLKTLLQKQKKVLQKLKETTQSELSASI